MSKNFYFILLIVAILVFLIGLLGFSDSDSKADNGMQRENKQKICISNHTEIMKEPDFYKNCIMFKCSPIYWIEVNKTICDEWGYQ